ncbi:MAG: nitrogenase component 1, partial [Synergistaceae bacterium]|nr:nitrogenase component 1 [Synergistaceae bacterium]
MARLSVWLPPFSPDYSGAASAFFDLNAVTAMHDASGCTGNYTGFDEPRWYGSAAAIYCSGLREMDVIMGDDEKLIVKMLKAGEDLKPDVYAVIGSPVPMVAGCDLRGIARELESRSGVVSVGIDTTGTAYYDRGLYMACAALLRRFGEPGPTRGGSVGILGASPMDFGEGENLRGLCRLLEENGFDIVGSVAMNYGLNVLRDAPKAQVNLAVSRAGYLISEYMRGEYGQPYLAGLPVGAEGAREYLAVLKNVMKSGESAIIKGERPSQRPGGVLVIGEQIQSNAIRRALNLGYGTEDVTVGALYGLEKTLAAEGDVDLPDERSIREEINSDRYGAVIADPFLYPLLRGEG